jgi:hypothetical protein
MVSKEDICKLGAIMAQQCNLQVTEEQIKIMQHNEKITLDEQSSDEQSGEELIEEWEDKVETQIAPFYLEKIDKFNETMGNTTCASQECSNTNHGLTYINSQDNTQLQESSLHTISPSVIADRQPLISSTTITQQKHEDQKKTTKEQLNVDESIKERGNKSQKESLETLKKEGTVVTPIDENDPMISSLVDNLVSLSQGSPDEFKKVIELACKRQKEFASIIQEAIHGNIQIDTGTTESEEKSLEPIEPRHRAYYLVMHLVNFSEIDAVIEKIKGNKEAMSKYIETVNEKIAKFKFDIDPQLERSLNSQFEGVKLIENDRGIKRIVLLPSTSVDERRTGKDMEKAVAASIYCRYKLFKLIDQNPRVCELMGVQKSFCNEEVDLHGVLKLQKQFPNSNLPRNTVKKVYINADNAPYADVFFEAGESLIGVQCKDLKPNVSPKKIRGRQLYAECKKVLSNEQKPCVELAIVAPNETELHCNTRNSLKKNDKEKIKQDLDNWKNKGQLYLANNLLHEVWKK